MDRPKSLAKLKDHVKSWVYKLFFNEFDFWKDLARILIKKYKTLWVKEKFLFTSNFSFSHGVFIRLILQTGKNKGLFVKGLKKKT